MKKDKSKKVEKTTPRGGFKGKPTKHNSRKQSHKRHSHSNSQRNRNSGRKSHEASQSEKSLIGTISLTSKGTGYVAVKEFDEDIEIGDKNLNTALHGDIVEISILPRDGGRRRRGKVTSVVERTKTIFVGTVVKKDIHYFIHPDDKKMYVDIAILDEQEHKLKVGTKAVIELADWKSPNHVPGGKIIRILGIAGAHETEMAAIVFAQGFDTKYPEAVEKEAEKIGEQREKIFEREIVGRRDFRSVTTFTIDPDDAKDFDDAISVMILKNGDIEIGIHIADVSAYIEEGDAIDEEAEARGTSIYLVDRTIPMLPEILSNDLCSLNPNTDKLTFSAVFVFDKNGSPTPKDRWFGKTIINSDKRFTYKEAQDILDKGEGLHYKELKVADDISASIRKERFKYGGIDFDTDEIKFELDKNSVPLRVYKKERIPTNLLIEDLMLLANREVATHMNEACKHIPESDTIFMYRIHDVPNPEKIDKLQIFLKALGHEIETHDGVVSARNFNDLFKKIEGTPEEQLIKMATVRSMAKAVYSLKNIGHFGLSFTYYTHFTSPIRRYPDLLVHRILKRHLDGSPITKKEFARYERLAIHASEREISAVEAERDSIKYKQVEYMQNFIGKEFDGSISGITEWGMYVEEKQTRAEGLVRIRDLTSDYFEVTNHGYSLHGKKTGTRYTVGDYVRIKLMGADLSQKTLDWALV